MLQSPTEHKGRASRDLELLLGRQNDPSKQLLGKEAGNKDDVRGRAIFVLMPPCVCFFFSSSFHIPELFFPLNPDLATPRGDRMFVPEQPVSSLAAALVSGSSSNMSSHMDDHRGETLPSFPSPRYQLL